MVRVRHKNHHQQAESNLIDNAKMTHLMIKVCRNAVDCIASIYAAKSLFILHCWTTRNESATIQRTQLAQYSHTQ